MNILFLLLTMAAAVDGSGAQFLIGNGGLTAGAANSGKLTVCRWPTPGSANQLSISMRPTDGAMWGIRVGDKPILWLDNPSLCNRDNEWPVVRTRSTIAGMTVVQETFVCQNRDILVTNIRIRGTAGPPEIVWYANFSPTARVMPEIPLGDILPEYLQDFALFTEDGGKTFVWFRPEKPGQADWQRAQDLPQSGNDFGDGVWIACAISTRLRGFQCGNVGTDTCAYRAALRGKFSDQAVAVGPCNLAMATQGFFEHDAYSTTVFATFGANREAAEANLQFALAQTVDDLVRESRQAWQKNLSAVKLPTGADEAVTNQYKQDLITLLLSYHKGSIVSAPLSMGALPLDFPKDGPFINLALDLAGFGELAREHTQFYAQAARQKSSPGAPQGTLPAALFASGGEGLPNLVLDAEAGAWWLASIWKDGTGIEEQQQREYFQSLWNRVEQVANFLCVWKDNRNQEPLYSFNYETWTHDQRPENILVTYMGIDSALRIASVLNGKAPAEWERRKRELDVLIRVKFIDENGAWKSDVILPYWHVEFLHDELPPWNNAAQKRLQENPKDIGRICDTAMIEQDNPLELQKLEQVLTEVELPSPLDTLSAAKHLIAAALIYQR